MVFYHPVQDGVTGIWILKRALFHCKISTSHDIAGGKLCDLTHARMRRGRFLELPHRDAQPFKFRVILQRLPH